MLKSVVFGFLFLFFLRGGLGEGGGEKRREQGREGKKGRRRVTTKKNSRVDQLPLARNEKPGGKIPFAHLAALLPECCRQEQQQSRGRRK